MGRHPLSRLALVGFLLTLGAARAESIEGRVSVHGTDGGVQGPVVVYLTGFKQPPLPDAPVVAQRNKTFVPDLRVVVAGQTVHFTNDDPVVHNVFSTSTARPFDLGKPGPGQTREVAFPSPGLVDVFCNIHETMFANVLVLPNRAFALVDDAGRFVIRDAPPGRWTLHAWGRNVEPFEMAVTVGPTAKPVAVVLQPRVFNPAHLDKFGRPYRQRAGYAP